MAYDELLEAGGREMKILPMMGAIYTRLFGEVPQNIPKNILSGTDQTQIQIPNKIEGESVT